MKNYAEQAEQLRSARVELEQGTEEDRQKTCELLPLFHQFVGFKIAQGQVSLEPVLWTNGAGKVCVWLRVAAADSTSPVELGTGLLSAEACNSRYKLSRYDPSRPGQLDSTDTHATLDGLMEAVAGAVSKL